MPATPFCAADAPTLTMLPPPASSMRGTMARTICSTLRTLTSKRRFQVSSAVSWTSSPMRNAPAMLHRTSIRPNRAMAAAATSPAAPGATRSAATDSRPPPSGPNRSASDSRRRSTRTRLAPRSANAAATAAPRLPAAPVTTTVRPLKSAPESVSVMTFRYSTQKSQVCAWRAGICYLRAFDRILRPPAGQAMSTTLATQAAPLRRRDALGVHSIDRFVFTVPVLADAERFYRAFGLDARRVGDRLDLYAHGHPHCWGSLFENGQPKKLQYLRFGAYPEDLEALAQRIRAAGSCAPHPLSDGEGLWIRDPDGTPIQVVVGPKVSASAKYRPAASAPVEPGKGAAPNRKTAAPVRPRRLSHVLLFTPDVERQVAFYSQVLGLRLSDRSA